MNEHESMAAAAARDESRPSTFSPIAIVGRACVFPGALSPEQLWEVVAEKRDVTSAVPPGRWRVPTEDVLCGPEDDPQDRAWSDRGGYVRGFETIWDPDGFGVPKAQLAGLDPLFHWVLHCARSALDDAGDRRRGAVARPRVSAVLGNLGFPTTEMSRYAEDHWLSPTLASNEPAPDPRNRFMSSGPARLLEQALGLRSGALSLDSACASSLYAIKLACDQLHDNLVDIALAGAVNRADDLFLHIGFTALNALSRSGQSRPFHCEADGLLPAEGAGVVALKRLADARRDRDAIYGVIRGVGLSNDGRGRGFLAPSEEGQRRALAAAYACAGLQPAQVSLLECHATGTVVGDASELRSTAAVFAGCQSVPLGSLKSNMGHLITAAGVAGLIKVVEAMRRGVRPPTLHLDAGEPVHTPTLAETPFRPIASPEPWPNEARPRIAGISAFGFGGNNAHLLVSEDDIRLDPLNPPRPVRRVPLAVVGLGAIVGSAAGVDEFRRQLESPPDNPDEATRRATAVTLALRDLRFPPSDLRSTLPQQLIVLAAAREAVATAPALSRERSGVYMAMEPDPEVCRHGARWRLAARARAAEARGVAPPDAGWVAETRDTLAAPLQAARVIGTMPNIPANRLNRQFDFGGPSWTVSAGERSGSIVLSLAARALATRELDAALVCGVDLSCQKVHVAALDAIDPSSGDAPGDAAVALVLRRLDDARAAGEHVLAVLDPCETGTRATVPSPLHASLRARFGRCWAAGELRELAAAVISVHPASDPRAATAAVGSRALTVPIPHETLDFTVRAPRRLPTLFSFAAATPQALVARLKAGSTGGQGSARAIVLARDARQLAQRCERASAAVRDSTNPGPGVYARTKPMRGGVALVFAGAGAAYPGMGAALLRLLPELHAAVRARSPGLARAYAEPWRDGEDVEPLHRLWSSSYLSQVHAELTLRWLELRPDAVIGYSSGESNSLFATGIWRDHDAMMEDCRRSGVFTEQIGGRLDAVRRAWAQPAATWETWTVLAPVFEVISAVDPEPRAHVSIVHHDHECVVAGDTTACARVRARMGGDARWLRLHYDLAVHVPELDEIAEPWRELHRRAVHPRPDLRVYSGGLASAYTPSREACAEAILTQAHRRLDFRAVIERAYSDGVRVFIEHGPRNSCSRWIRAILGEREAEVVALDRKGADIQPILETLAVLTAAGVPHNPTRALEAMSRHRSAARSAAAHSSGPSLTLPAHAEPLIRSAASAGSNGSSLPAHAEPLIRSAASVGTSASDLSRSSHPRPTPSPTSEPTMQRMPEAPPLPPVGASQPAPTTARAVSVTPSSASTTGPAVPPLLGAPSNQRPGSRPATPPEEPASTTGPPPLLGAPSNQRPASQPVAPSEEPALAQWHATLQAQMVMLGHQQRAFIEQQTALHQQFLETRAHAISTLVAAASDRVHAPPPNRLTAAHRSPAPTPVTPTQPPVSLTTTTRARVSVTSSPAPTSTAPSPRKTHPKPRSSTPISAPRPVPTSTDRSPTKTPAPRSSTPTSTPRPAPANDSLSANGPRAPIGPTFDRPSLETHASGRISKVFGPEFSAQDGFRRQVRMPMEPLLLADRVTGLDATANSMKLGTIWTETDVREDSWYLHAGRMPAGIMIESGQADLMLISYLGVDRENCSERVYRLLGCTLTFHGGLPRPGETLCYDIHLDGHAKQGRTRLMFFHYDCHIDGARRLSVRQGQAGFFTDAELAGSDGCLWRPEDQEINQSPRMDPPDVSSERSSFTPEQVRAFAEGEPWRCFGNGFALTRSHTRSPRIQQGRMLFLDRVDRFEVRGGPWDRGYLRATAGVEARAWFFDGHFHNDPCMPGTLMFEGCLQAMAFYLTALGYTVERDGWRFEPVQDEPFKLSCRGQVTPSSRELIYEVYVEEVISGPIPTVYADLLCTVDGLKAFHARRVGLRLVPSWPLDEGHVLLDRATESDANGASETRNTVARAGDFSFDYRSMLACACGRPTEAFGPIYARFDSHLTVPRLPNPPYHFITRATRLRGAIGEALQGAEVEVEFELDPDAWYFAENGARTMPFAVLLEAALQPCGWLASYMGCALTGDIPLKFRNLDGTGTLHRELPPNGGVLTTRVKNTSLSKTASMIIVGFDVECRLGDALVYSMNTVFGFFPASAFADQAGLPTTDEQRALLQTSATGEAAPVDLTKPSNAAPRLAAPMLRMIDRVVDFDPEGGAAGLGCARAEKDVDPSEWFFAAHFFQDPVQPGSLGIEAMIQLLQWCMRALGLQESIESPRFEPLALGHALTWKYRGQVVPTDQVITTTLEITERGVDERGAFALATASLWIDGKRIYEARGLGMRIVSDEGSRHPGHGRRYPLSLDTRPWLRDHRPTYTVPAMPMMSMIALLADAARADERLIGLRDVRVKGWLTVDEREHSTLRSDRDGEWVTLVLEHGDGRPERVIATARLRIGSYGTRPPTLPPIAGAPTVRPYEDGSLFHGPTFQLVEHLTRDASGASSKIRLPGHDPDDTSRPPVGRLDPLVLDAATHGIPHDRLDLWDADQPRDRVAYPAWIPELDLYDTVPSETELRCEVRPDGHVGSRDFPAFSIQLIDSRGVWCSFRLVEACFPKGPLGQAEPMCRRAFLRDRAHGLELSLSRRDARGVSTLARADITNSDWLPGTVEAIYGTTDAGELVRREHIAAAHKLHPGALPAALPLTRWDLDVSAGEHEVTVRGDGWGHLDIRPVRNFWTRWFDRDPWPVEDIYYGLIERFVRRVVVTDPVAFAELRGRSALYVANHQVAIESLLFSVLCSGLTEVPTVTLAKIEHQQTWVGQLIDLCFRYPGVRDPRLIAFFDRADKSSLPAIIGDLATEMTGPGRSIMVHVEGTRSRSCADPVQKMSGAFIDMALHVGAPVVPVRFVGGLPREPLATRREFPLGMGTQDIWIGRPLLPETLAALPYGERKRLVVNAINDLGPRNADERPNPPAPEFAASVDAWHKDHHVSHPHAAIGTVLSQHPTSGDAVRRLLAARHHPAALAADMSPEGRWLQELALRVLGSNP